MKPIYILLACFLLRGVVERSTEYAGTNIKHQAPTQQLQEQGKPEQAPLGSFRVGDAVLELGGSVDLENIFRTTNTQSNIATNFGSFPYNNTPQKHTCWVRLAGRPPHTTGLYSFLQRA